MGLPGSRNTPVISLWSAPLLIATLAVLLSSPPLSQWDISTAVLLTARLFGLLGLMYGVIIALSGARFGFLERAVGLDVLLRLHTRLAPVVVALLLAHAGLLIWRLAHLTGMGPVPAFQNLTAVWEVRLGSAALVMLLAAAGAAKAGLFGLAPWRAWKPVHLLPYPAMLLAFIHAWFRGGDFETAAFKSGALLLLAAFLMGGALRLRYIFAIRPKMSAVLRETKDESHDTRTFILDPEHEHPIWSARHAGQFSMVRRQEPGRWGEPRPFTLSGAPQRPELQFTIKKHGRFTSALWRLEPGAKMLCEGPYGRFLTGVETLPKIVFLAGGVGVTPFLSALRTLADSCDDPAIQMIWANKTLADAFALEELRALSQSIDLRVAHALSRESVAPPAGDGQTFELGRITPQMLQRHCDMDAHFFICGPPALQRFLNHTLRHDFQVPAKKIDAEVFSW